MRGRKLSFTIALSAEERAALEHLSRTTTLPVGEWKRTRAILLLGEQRSEKETGRLCGLGARIVRKWARRYLEQGVTGLKDKPGRGRKPVFPP